MNEIDAKQELELIRAFQGGERWAFDELMTLHEKRAYRIALGMLGDHDRAADVTQEAFLRAFRSLGDFEFRARFGTWLHRIVVNLCIGQIRRERLQKTLSLEAVSERLKTTLGRPARDLARKDLAQCIESAVGSLPPRQRAVFVLRHDEGLSLKEIAGIVGRSEGAIRASYFQAVRKLREELKEHD